MAAKKRLNLQKKYKKVRHMIIHGGKGCSSKNRYNVTYQLILTTHERIFTSWL